MITAKKALQITNTDGKNNKTIKDKKLLRWVADLIETGAEQGSSFILVENQYMTEYVLEKLTDNGFVVTPNDDLSKIDWSTADEP